MKNISSLLLCFCFSCCAAPISGEAPVILHDLWGLKEINGKNIIPGEGVILELFPKKGTFLFTANQETFQGQFQANSTRIKFSSIKSLPTSSLPLASEFSTTLPKARRWTLEKGHLHLYDRKNQLLARFIKAD